MNEIGDFLKNAREQQGLELSDVANSTKIHISKLKAIEEGDLSTLPAKVFLVGLIKSYARELKIDSDTINRLCNEAYKVKTEAPLPPPEVITTPEDSSETQNLGLFQLPKSLIVGISVVISLALAAIIFIVIEKMNSYSEETKIPGTIFQEHDSTTPSLDTETHGTSDSKDQAESDAVAVIKPQPSHPTIEKEAPSQTRAQETSTPPQENIQLSKTPPPPITEDNSTEDEVKPLPQNAADTAIVRSDKKLILTALEPVRAEILWEDGFVQVMLLKSQETKTLVFSTPITLRINNGGAVKVQLNNDEAKIPGKLNQPVELEFK